MGEGRDAATPSEVFMGPHSVEYRTANVISPGRATQTAR